MQLWRMSAQLGLEEAYAQERAGRWHRAGARLLYASQSAELAVLEALVHHCIGMGGYHVLSVAVPRAARAEAITLDDLPADWRQRKAITRAIGTRWLEEARTAMLRVPSAVVPIAHNYLLNPDHPAVRGRLRLRDHGPLRFDRRLVDPNRPQ